MIEFEMGVFINRPQQEVFDFISNPANDAQWQSSIEASEWTSQGPPRVGSTRRFVIRFLGREIDSTNEVTSWDPPSQFGLKSLSGPIPFEFTIKLNSQENGTQLTENFQAEVGGFFKLAEGLVGKQMAKEFDTDFDALKHLLEPGQALSVSPAIGTT